MQRGIRQIFLYLRVLLIGCCFINYLYLLKYIMNPSFGTDIAWYSAKKAYKFF